MLANHHRRVNFLDELTIDGQLLQNNNDIRNGVCKYFQKLYTETIGSRPRLDDLTFNTIDMDDCLSVEKKFF